MEAPLLEENIWQVYRDRGIMVFAMNRQSYEVVQDWVLDFDLTHPAVHDPPPSDSYWKYSHGYIPQNTLTDKDFVVIYDTIGYDENALVTAIEANLCPVSVVLEGSAEEVVRGGYYDFTVTLTNWGNTVQSFSAWLDAIMPNHLPAPRNPQLGPVTVTLDPGVVITRNLSIFVPGNTPAGDNYRIKVSIGTHPDDITNCDLLEVDVLAR